MSRPQDPLVSTLSSSTSSLHTRRAEDATVLEAPQQDQPPLWGGVSPSPAVRPVRSGRRPAQHILPHATTRRPLTGAPHTSAAKPAAATSTPVAPSTYARHYAPFYANASASSARSATGTSHMQARYDALLHRAAAGNHLAEDDHTSSHSSGGGGGSGASTSGSARHTSDTTEVIARRYRQFLAEWEEWHGIMTAVGPQRFSTMLAQAQSGLHPTCRTGEASGEESHAGLSAWLHRLVTQLRLAGPMPSLSTSSIFHHRRRRRAATSGWLRGRGGPRRRLRWPRTRVDGVSILHVQLLRWCREELVPYLLAKAGSAVSSLTTALPNGLGSVAWDGTGGGDWEGSNVELLFSESSEWGCASSRAEDAQHPQTATGRAASADLASTSSDDDEAAGGDERHAMPVTDVGSFPGTQPATTTGPPPRFTLAWVRGVCRADPSRRREPPSATSSPDATTAAEAPTLLRRLMRILGMRTTSTHRRSRGKAHRYRRARDTPEPLDFTELDRLVLAQVLALMPSIWERPLPQTMPPVCGAGETAPLYSRHAAPYVPLSDFSRGAASAALDLSLTPTTLDTARTNTNSSTEPTSQRMSGGEDEASVQQLGSHAFAADVRLRHSLAALEVCAARHHSARMWEKANGDVLPATSTATGTRVDATAAPFSATSSSSRPSSGPAVEDAPRHSQSVLYSAAHEAIHALPRRRLFHHPAAASLPYWQSEHESYMTACLQEAVVARRMADAAAQTRAPADDNKTPYWQRSGDGAAGLMPLLTDTALGLGVADSLVRDAFDKITATFCESITSVSVERALRARHGAADRAASEWLLRHMSDCVSRVLAGVTARQGQSSMGRGVASAVPPPPRGVLASIRSGTPVSLAALELSEEDVEALAKVREKADCMDTAVSLRTAGFSVTFSQLASLRPRTWLNDQIINNYLQLLCESDIDRHGGEEGVVSLGSHFYSKVQSELEMLRATSGTTQTPSLPPLPPTNTLLRWLRRRRHCLEPHAPASFNLPNTTTVHTILIPVNLSGQHWALVVARKPRPSTLADAKAAAESPLTMSWTFYDSMCPPSARHPRGMRILHELRHALAECERHLVWPSLLQVRPKHALAKAANGTPLPPRGSCRIALPLHPSKDFSLELGHKRPFASLEALDAEEKALTARLEAQQKRHRRDWAGDNAGHDAVETAEAREARLRRVAARLVRDTELSVPELLRRAASADASKLPLRRDPSDAVEEDQDSASRPAAAYYHLGEDGEEVDNRDVEWFTPGAFHTPQQQNGYDCGVFVCQVAWCAAQGVAVSFSQSSDMLRMREVMTLELLSKKLLPRLPTTHMSSSIDVNAFHHTFP